jgi:hypothetical protein
MRAEGAASLRAHGTGDHSELSYSYYKTRRCHNLEWRVIRRYSSTTTDTSVRMIEGARKRERWTRGST